MNSKIVIDRRANINGQPVVMVYGIVVGQDYGLPNDGKRRIVAADTLITPERVYVEDTNDHLGSPEDILARHLNFDHWIKENGH